MREIHSLKLTCRVGSAFIRIDRSVHSTYFDVSRVCITALVECWKECRASNTFHGCQKVEREARAKELLTSVNLEHSYNKRPHELSGGMKQRVAIARALAQDSKILLMDEPFAALDAITRDLLHEEIVRIWRENNLTVVFVTHNVREAVRLGQRVLLMSSRPGRFVKEWKIDIKEPRRIDSPEIALMAREITDDLRSEIRRHADA